MSVCTRPIVAAKNAVAAPKQATHIMANSDMVKRKFSRATMYTPAVTIVAAFESVGSILVIAMLIAPGATAYLLSDRFERMLVIAVVVACTSAVLGTFISFHIDGATGACIVLVQSMAFFAARKATRNMGSRRARRPSSDRCGSSAVA